MLSGIRQKNVEAFLRKIVDVFLLNLAICFSTSH